MMRWLVSACFPAMAVAHIVELGLPRYFPIIGLMLLLVFYGRSIYLPSKRWWYPIGFAVYLVSSGAASLQYGDTLSYAYVGFGLLNFVLYPIYERIRLTNLHLLIVLAILFVSIIPLELGRRVVSIYDNQNNYSAVVFATLYVGMLLFRGRFFWQLVTVGVFGGLIFIGASRSMLGATLVFALLYFGQTYVLRTTLRLSFVLAFAVASVGYYSLITSDEFRIMEVIQANTYSDKRERGLSHRDELFYKAYALVEERPSGYGLGMSNDALKNKFGESVSPHNTYLKIAVEGGVLALAAYLFVVVCFWLTSASPLASSFIFALMIRGFFESSTPLSLSLISGMLVIPMFLNEHTVTAGYRLALPGWPRSGEGRQRENSTSEPA